MTEELFNAITTLQSKFGMVPPPPALVPQAADATSEHMSVSGDEEDKGDLSNYELMPPQPSPEEEERTGDVRSLPPIRSLAGVFEKQYAAQAEEAISDQGGDDSSALMVNVAPTAALALSVSRMLLSRASSLRHVASPTEDCPALVPPDVDREARRVGSIL
jgi:hypothetical protein